MIGYSRDAGASFTYLLMMFSTSLSMSGLFRFIGSIAATPVHAQVTALSKQKARVAADCSVRCSS